MEELKREELEKLLYLADNEYQQANYRAQNWDDSDIATIKLYEIKRDFFSDLITKIQKRLVEVMRN